MTKQKTALITGITGQDGSYLLDLLLEKGYRVIGIKRRTSTISTDRVDRNYDNPNFKMYYGSMTEASWMYRLLTKYQPDEIYNLAAQSHVRVSFDMPEYTGDVTGIGTLRILEAVRRSGRKVRFYQASTSELFGSAKPPQSETTPFEPQSPYAAAKAYAHWLTKNYRDGYGIFASTGILFNHESPRRGETFVTRKITRAVASILAGKQKKLYMGNLDSLRDWGYAPEYVEVMWRLLQLDQPAEIVIGTGESHTVREFLNEAFGYVGLNYEDYVQIDPQYFRPTEVDYLLAEPKKARELLGWEPKIRFHELVRIMMDADLELLGLEVPGEGKRLLAERFDGWHRWEDQVISMDR